jgi:hypothetical protein
MEGDGVQRIATQISFHSRRFLFKYVILHTSSFISPQFNHYNSVMTFTFLLFFQLFSFIFTWKCCYTHAKTKIINQTKENVLEFSWFYIIFSFGRFEWRTPWTSFLSEKEVTHPFFANLQPTKITSAYRYHKWKRPRFLCCRDKN